MRCLGLFATVARGGSRRLPQECQVFQCRPLIVARTITAARNAGHRVTRLVFRPTVKRSLPYAARRDVRLPSSVLPKPSAATDQCCAPLCIDYLEKVEGDTSHTTGYCFRSRLHHCGLPLILLRSILLNQRCDSCDQCSRGNRESSAKAEDD